MLKRFLCLLCALLMAAPCAFAEPEMIIPESYEQNGTLSVYAAIPRDFTQVVTPEMFNDSGIAKSSTDKHGIRSITFHDEAQLHVHHEALYYNEYGGEEEQIYELENGKTYSEMLPKPSIAHAASSLAGWMTFGWPGTREIYPLEKESLTHITLAEAKERTEALLATLKMEGYVCETALDMSLERILEMGKKWGKLLDDGVLVSSYRFDTRLATTQDEGYFLRYRRFGTESDLSGQFHADLYVTADGFASINITDLYATGEILSTPETLISWQEAAKSLPKELADSRMQPVLNEITVARLAWCPVREKESPSGMAFTPAWVLAFTAQSDGQNSEMHAIFNAVTGKMITGNWY